MKEQQRVEVHKIASVVYRLGLGRSVLISTERRKAQEGDVVLVRAEAEKRVYGELELVEGRMAKIFRGDLIVGALGTRRALKGYVGSTPKELGPGDRLAILNLGGVLGVPEISEHPDLGPPCPVRVIGFVLNQQGEVLSVRNNRLKQRESSSLPSLVVVSGTSMASGKTRAACEVVHELFSQGKRINAGKLTGIACLRDLFAMGDHGAQRVASFLDCGLVSTVGVSDIAGFSRTVLAHLASDNPDAVVVELGDGLLGDYGVLKVLKDLRNEISVHIVCAIDPVGAWGAWELLREEGVPLHLVSGPCTDSIVGLRFIREKLGLEGANACSAPHKLGALVLKLMEKGE